jgi:hypothetical protein
MIPQCAFRDRIELPGRYIGLELSVPDVRVKLCEPLPKGSQLFRRKFLDSVLTICILTWMSSNPASWMV